MLGDQKFSTSNRSAKRLGISFAKIRFLKSMSISSLNILWETLKRWSISSVSPWSNLKRALQDTLKRNMKNSVMETFKEKWEHNRQLAFEETLKEGSEIFSWILGRKGFASANELKE